MLGRIVIDGVRPSTPRGYAAKAVVGEHVLVSADIYRDGHDVLAGRVRWRALGSRRWKSAPLSEVGNDRWEGIIVAGQLGGHEFIVEAWTDWYQTWRHDVTTKLGVGQDIELELEEGAQLLETRLSSRSKKHHLRLREAVDALRNKSLGPHERLSPAVGEPIAQVFIDDPFQTDLCRSPAMALWVDRSLALFGAWYEMFPRSEGGFQGATKRLAAIAEMGFDVVYLPPIHPIGKTHRKGPNNSVTSAKDDPGSPWAIGDESGGHTAIHPELGSLEDLQRFIQEAESLGMEVALDYALQCSPDHPWVKEHPEWFYLRTDGSIKYAENPPKKYEDIYPINYWPEKGREELWQASREVVEYWIGCGIKIFRVDNPHTKPFAFWEWLIRVVQTEHPEVVFLSEAFTRPKLMAKLAEVGFTQSYTYFTWRNNKDELMSYLLELAHGPTADFMRPNFWTNTPDILSGPLRGGGAAAFKMRLVLAATMVPSYGIYSGFELGENQPASDDNEEYLDSEKYELKERDWETSDSLAPFVARVNRIRKRHPAFHWLRNIHFHHADNPNIIIYSKHTDDLRDVILIVVSLDPESVQTATVWLDLGRLGIPEDTPFDAIDELTDSTFEWLGPSAYVRLDPDVEPAHILHLVPSLDRAVAAPVRVEAKPEIWKG